MLYQKCMIPARRLYGDLDYTFGATLEKAVGILNGGKRIRVMRDKVCGADFTGYQRQRIIPCCSRMRPHLRF